MTAFWIFLLFKGILITIFYEKTYCFYERVIPNLYDWCKKRPAQIRKRYSVYRNEPRTCTAKSENRKKNNIYRYLCYLVWAVYAAEIKNVPE
jgi:hypothetical protein